MKKSMNKIWTCRTVELGFAVLSFSGATDPDEMKIWAMRKSKQTKSRSGPLSLIFWPNYERGRARCTRTLLANGMSLTNSIRGPRAHNTVYINPKSRMYNTYTMYLQKRTIVFSQLHTYPLDYLILTQLGGRSHYGGADYRINQGSTTHTVQSIFRT